MAFGAVYSLGELRFVLKLYYLVVELNPVQHMHQNLIACFDKNLNPLQPMPRFEAYEAEGVLRIRTSSMRPGSFYVQNER